MQAAPSFADLLDEKIGAFGRERHAAAAPASGYASAAASGFFFLYTSDRSAAAGAYRRASLDAQPCSDVPRSARVATPMVRGHAAASSFRRVRVLSPRHRRAFDALLALGAAISPDFTSEELRSAFRRLARHYHPDASPACTDAERTRLAQQFSELREAYRQLQTLAA